jgi:hypothetical protein
MKFKDSWTAEWEGHVLHISGLTDRFPNSFSTASLRRIASQIAGAVAYQIEFHRDKEPFCDPDLVGAVHYYEQAFPSDARLITISVPGESDAATVQVPRPREAPRSAKHHRER